MPQIDFRSLYNHFNAPMTPFDCGKKCAPHNPHGIPFCCDICTAVPVAYKPEWDYLKQSTDLWHVWRGDECSQEPCDPAELLKDTPESMLLLACQGPAHCQRDFRAISCRQFPFFPYITSDDRFIGLAYYWDFEPTCWVINNLATVTPEYRDEFVHLYDDLFSRWPDDYENYAQTSEDMREAFADQRRRIPILHRNGGYYLVSPISERIRRVAPEAFRKFGPYRAEDNAQDNLP